MEYYFVGLWLFGMGCQGFRVYELKFWGLELAGFGVLRGLGFIGLKHRVLGLSRFGCKSCFEAISFRAWARNCPDSVCSMINIGV